MKSCIFLMPFLFPSLILFAQRQLDVQGVPNSTDTVATIKVNYTGHTSVIGLAVHSETENGLGIGGSFFGGASGICGRSNLRAGVFGESDSGLGVHGQSSDYYGVKGTSEFGTGAYFIGFGGTAIELGGSNSDYDGGFDDAVIRTEVDQMGGDMILVSNDAIDLHLDDDNNSSAQFKIKNGNDNVILSLDEEGNAHLTSNVINDYARLRMKNPDNADFWDIAGGGVNNDELNFFRSGGVGNVMQLHATGNPITTSTGAYLSPGGMWTDNSSKTLKHLERFARPYTMLAAISQLPIYYWRYKTEPQTLHIGPVAEDFHEVFGCGAGDQHLAPSDLAAVALAAVQALHEENVRLQERLDGLEGAIQELKKHQLMGRMVVEN